MKNTKRGVTDLIAFYALKISNKIPIYRLFNFGKQATNYRPQYVLLYGPQVRYCCLVLN